MFVTGVGFSTSWKKTRKIRRQNGSGIDSTMADQLLIEVETEFYFHLMFNPDTERIKYCTTQSVI